MDNNNLWTRRSNTSKLSLSTPSAPSTTSNNSNDHPTRNYTLTKRFGPESATSSHSNKNPFSTMSPSTAMPSPTTTKPSNAFSLGTGAFASFGGGGKLPKTPGASPGNALDFGSGKTPNIEKTAKDSGLAKANNSRQAHALLTSWTFWYRPPHQKSNQSQHQNNSSASYEKSIQAMCSCSTVEEFFLCYKHLKRPSSLPQVSDYHFFRNGVRPVWEDEENKKGGKWVVRLKKGVADRYWEDLLFAVIGDQFGEEKQKDDEVMGVVLSMRNGEDVLSVWIGSDRKALKIRDTLKRVLNFPSNTIIEYKSHDQSISQRATIDEQRKERPQPDRQQSQRGPERQRNISGNENQSIQAL